MHAKSSNLGIRGKDFQSVSNRLTAPRWRPRRRVSQRIWVFISMSHTTVPTHTAEVAIYTQLSDQYYVYMYILALLFMMKRIHKHLKTSKVKRDNLTRIIYIFYCWRIFRILAIILIYCHVDFTTYDFFFRYVNKRCDIWCPLTPAHIACAGSDAPAAGSPPRGPSAVWWEEQYEKEEAKCPRFYMWYTFYNAPNAKYIYPVRGLHASPGETNLRADVRLTHVGPNCESH